MSESMNETATVTDPDNAFIDRFELRGEPGAPLAGTTFAIKDVYDVEGHVTGAGNPDWARTHHAATRHTPLLRDFLAAGATCLGKTHTDEIAYSLMGVNAHYGTPRNPAAPDRVPGGSSSGSAVAVAAGAVDFALGTDTGGSVRLPASFCGIFGIRTSHGRLPLEGVVPLAPSFDTVGWFARDVAMMLRAANGLGLVGDAPAAAPLTRVLMPRDLWALASSDTQEALAPRRRAVADVLGVANEEPINPDGFDLWRETFRICQAAEVWSAHGAWVTATAPNFGADVAARFEMARNIAPDEAATARRNRAEIAARLRDLMEPDGVLVIPTAPDPAPLRAAAIGDLETFRARALALLCAAGLAGLPQVSLPAARVAGAPVGLSLVGPPGRDHALLELAACLPHFS